MPEEFEKDLNTDDAESTELDPDLILDADDPEAHAPLDDDEVDPFKDKWEE